MTLSDCCNDRTLIRDGFGAVWCLSCGWVHREADESEGSE